MVSSAPPAAPVKRLCTAGCDNTLQVRACLSSALPRSNSSGRSASGGSYRLSGSREERQHSGAATALAVTHAQLMQDYKTTMTDVRVIGRPAALLPPSQQLQPCRCVRMYLRLHSASWSSRHVQATSCCGTCILQPCQVNCCCCCRCGAAAKRAGGWRPLCWHTATGCVMQRGPPTWGCHSTPSQAQDRTVR
jgi:hypothetical protein